MARAGRILFAAEASHAVPVDVSAPESTERSRVIEANLVAAQLQVKALLEQAEAQAQQVYERRLAELESDVQARTLEFERACQKRESEWALREIAEQNGSLQRQKDALMSLSCLLAERLLGEQLRLMPSTILALTQEVLREARGAKRLRLWASPADAPTLASLQSTLIEQFQAEVEVSEEPSLARGELIIESELGRTEARLKTRLSCLVEVLRERSQP